jgi:hypothetical protein
MVASPVAVVLSQAQVPQPPLASGQIPLALATEGMQRVVWESRFGPILIEVVDGVCFVNREPVEPASTLNEGNKG